MSEVSNKDLMDAITAVRLELKGDIKGVDDKVNALATAQAIDKTKIGALVTSISIVISAVATVVLENSKKLL